MEVIPYPLMTYQHVARGIYPDFFGKQIDSEWQSDIDKDFTMSFSIPSTVMDLNNTEVVLLIMDPSTQKIVASDNLAASGFTAGIENVTDITPTWDITAKGDNITIQAPIGSLVRIYSTAGLKITEATLNDTSISIKTSAKGILPVNITMPDGTTANKKVIIL